MSNWVFEMKEVGVEWLLDGQIKENIAWLGFIMVVVPFHHLAHIICVIAVRSGCHLDIDRESIDQGSIRMLTHCRVKDSGGYMCTHGRMCPLKKIFICLITRLQDLLVMLSHCPGGCCQLPCC